MAIPKILKAFKQVFAFFKKMAAKRRETKFVKAIEKAKAKKSTKDLQKSFGDVLGDK